MPQETQEIEKEVVEIVARQGGLDTSEVTPAKHLMADLGLDSLDIAEVTMELEDAFSIAIPDAEAQNIQTVGQVIDYVKRHTPLA